MMVLSKLRISIGILVISISFILSETTVMMGASAFRTNPSNVSAQHAISRKQRKGKYDELRQEWNEKSRSYYSKVTREERRRNAGEIDGDVLTSEEYRKEFERMARKHYFALQKIKEGRYRHAEILYERIIREILQEEKEGDSCDHAKLAVTTLLFALHCQRMGNNPKKTRSVFLNFFRQIVMNEEGRTRTNGNKNDGDAAFDANENEHHHCACSAKVLGAFALFEMKQGNSVKSLEIARMAVDFDPSLRPMLEWKQFRDTRMRTKRKTRVAIGKVAENQRAL